MNKARAKIAALDWLYNMVIVTIGFAVGTAVLAMEPLTGTPGQVTFDEVFVLVVALLLGYGAASVADTLLIGVKDGWRTRLVAAAEQADRHQPGGAAK